MNSPSTHPAQSQPNGGSTLDAALFAASGTSLVACFLFDAIQKYTHHRPLGAATLAILTVLVFLGLLVSSARFRVGPRIARASLVVAAVLLVALAI